MVSILESYQVLVFDRDWVPLLHLAAVSIYGRFLEILASTYLPVPLLILKNILIQICSRTLFEKHAAPGAYSKHAPGAVCILNTALEHICLWKLFQIINGPGPYGPGAQSRTIWSWTISRGQKSPKSPSEMDDFFDA